MRGDAPGTVIILTGSTRMRMEVLGVPAVNGGWAGKPEAGCMDGMDGTWQDDLLAHMCREEGEGGLVACNCVL